MRNSGERLADLRAQSAANRAGAGPRRRARRAHWAPTRSAPAWRRSSTTPSAARGRRSRRSPTATTRRRDVLEGGADGRDRDRAARAGDGRRRGARPRLRRHGGAGRGQPQLPAGGDEVGGVLRRPRPHRPRRPAVGRRPPADRGARAGGLPAQRASRRRPSRRATSRPRAGSPTSSSRRSPAARPRRLRARGR